MAPVDPALRPSPAPTPELRPVRPTLSRSSTAVSYFSARDTLSSGTSTPAPSRPVLTQPLPSECTTIRLPPHFKSLCGPCDRTDSPTPGSAGSPRRRLSADLALYPYTKLPNWALGDLPPPCAPVPVAATDKTPAATPAPAKASWTSHGAKALALGKMPLQALAQCVLEVAYLSLLLPMIIPQFLAGAVGAAVGFARSPRAHTTRNQQAKIDFYDAFDRAEFIPPAYFEAIDAKIDWVWTL